MKKIFGGLLLCILSMGAECDPPPPDPSIRSGITPFTERFIDPGVYLDPVRGIHNITHRGKRCIQLDLIAYFKRLENIDCVISVYFFDEFGRPLRDINGDYRDVYGFVAFAQRVRLPAQNPMKVSLFMPYEELHVQPGTKVLCRFKINDIGVRIALDKTNFYSFTVPGL